MRKRFDEQLEELGKEMQTMGMMVEESIQKAIEALLRQDVELAKSVMESDALVDQKQKEIESICFTLLMQQQPVASDLRSISAALKMVTDMERIGDHAADISEMITHLADEPYIKNLDHIRQMASETMWMLIQSIEAYVEKDVKKATGVIVHDDVVDNLFAETGDIIASARYASAAAAISVQHLGAQPSLPEKEAVEAFLAERA